MRRFAVASVIAAVVAVALSGCGASLGSPTDEFESVDPSHLVGVWHVENAAGAGRNTWLRLADGVKVWTDCGTANGSWSARSDAFLANLYIFDGEGCAFDDFPAYWLRNATGYGYVDGELTLLNRLNVPLATLTVGTPPPQTDPGYFDEEVLQPTRSASISRQYIDAAPLPEGVEPTRDLVGRWAPAGYDGSSMYMDFLADGRFSGSHACGGRGGRWLAAVDGSLLTTSGGLISAVGCSSDSPVLNAMMNSMDSIHQATTVGMNGDELTFYGPEGEVIATLVRE